MCREDGRGAGAGLHLTEEEEIAAEESLSMYCKPVELYNILQRRAIGNVIIFTFYLIVFFFYVVICFAFLIEYTFFLSMR